MLDHDATSVNTSFDIGDFFGQPILTNTMKRGDKMAKKSNMNELEQQANEILEKAKELGLEYNFLFTKTFANYVYNLKLLEKCKEDIDENGYTVSKEYIKGLANEQPSASLKQFNTSLTNANRTAETLLKIIKDCKTENGAEEVDPLLEIINGGDDSEN